MPETPGFQWLVCASNPSAYSKPTSQKTKREGEGGGKTEKKNPIILFIFIFVENGFVFVPEYLVTLTQT